MLAAGATAVGVALGKTLQAGSEEGPASGTATGPATPDHRIVHLPMAGSTREAGQMLPAAEPTGRTGVPGRKWIMVLDLAACDGCAKCTEACNKMHFIPPDRQYIPVYKIGEHETRAKDKPGSAPEPDKSLTAPYFFPRPCFHCDNPPCTKVCPVDATYKTQDGTVLIDNDRCIGCRFCMAACPYGARSFNWGVPTNTETELEHGYSPEWGYPRKIGTVEKCDFCPEHAARGILPACAAACPMRVIYFGDENEDAVTNSAGETVRLRKFLRDRAAYRHLESLGTEPRVYYLPPTNRLYPAPGEKGSGS